MEILDRDGLDTALDRFSQAHSLFAPERVCIATAGGRLPALHTMHGCTVLWVGSSLPWFFRPLGLIAAASRCLVELGEPASISAFAREADDCFTVKFCSFSRTLLPAVVSHLRSGGWHDPAEVADHDPTYAELEFNCDGHGHEGWLVLVRFNRDCPADLVGALSDVGPD